MCYDYNDKIEFIEYINSLEKEFNIHIDNYLNGEKDLSEITDKMNISDMIDIMTNLKHLHNCETKEDLIKLIDSEIEIIKSV
jgi:hypothetical protein